jgi:hypothetical protein
MKTFLLFLLTFFLICGLFGEVKAQPKPAPTPTRILMPTPTRVIVPTRIPPPKRKPAPRQPVGEPNKIPTPMSPVKPVA